MCPTTQHAHPGDAATLGGAALSAAVARHLQ
jgi:hypothetical protein